MEPLTLGVESRRLSRKAGSARGAPPRDAPGRTGRTPPDIGLGADAGVLGHRRFDATPDALEIEPLDVVGNGRAERPLDALALRDRSVAGAAARDVERGLAHLLVVEFAVEETVEECLRVAAVHANSFRRFWSFLRA